jgi:hypothetical protein
MTGAVVARRKPVWFTRYDEVPGGHLAADERATLRGVIGVPLEWRGRVIGACIVFSRDDLRVFGPDDAELLELFARHAAIALATARMHEVAEERARAEAAAAERDRLLGEVHDSLAQALMINGLGGTPISELYLLYGYAYEQLAQRGINVRRNYVGNYCTSLDMAGVSITLSRLDQEIGELLAAPAEIAIRTF